MLQNMASRWDIIIWVIISLLFYRGKMFYHEKDAQNVVIWVNHFIMVWNLYWKFKTATAVNLDVTKYNLVWLFQYWTLLAKIIQFFVSWRCENQWYKVLTLKRRYAGEITDDNCHEWWEKRLSNFNPVWADLTNKSLSPSILLIPPNCLFMTF